MPLLPRIGGRMVKREPETCEINEDGVGSKRKSDWVDLIMCDMTLKELQERCKPKKKKFPKSGDLIKQDTKTCFHLDGVSSTEGDFNLQPKEDESDLEKPLSIWKLKLSNKAKAKGKCIRKHMCSSSKYAVSGEALTERIMSAPQDSLQNIRDVHEPSYIKIEISEPDSSDCQNVSCVTNVSTPECRVKMDFFRELSDELPRRVNGGDIEIGESTSFTKESSNCVVNEVSFEYLDLGEPVSLPISETQFFSEITQMHFPQIISQSSLSSHVFELMEEGNITHPLPIYSPAEAVSVTKNPGSDITRISESYSFPHEISCQMDNNTVPQLPDMAIDEKFQCMELIHGGNRCDSDMRGKGESKEDTSSDLKESLYIASQMSHPCFDPNNAADFSCDGSPIAKEKLSFSTINGTLSAGVDITVNCSPWTCLGDESNRLTAAEVPENHHGVQPERPPHRLFSTRKVMSPTFQEKLCQAVDANELYDNIERFGSGLEGVKVPTRPERVIKKPKNNKNGSLQLVPKGILKAPHVSFVLPYDGTECTSIHAHAQKAVAFSQRQMHDIECLAMKLMQELNSMKNIVEETLCSNACSSTPKYSADEMRMAVENSAELEETTKKWLSMMARDCNRFCKIMRLTKKKTAAAFGYGVHKKKKITFADEAGGMLCHARFLKRVQHLFWSLKMRRLTRNCMLTKTDASALYITLLILKNANSMLK